MKQETLKELGKYFLDISKVLLALTLISPVMKDEKLSNGTIFISALIVIALFTVGIYFTNKGVKDE